MKILKKRYIISGLLIIVLVVFLGLYFIGGLKASATYKFNNEEFNEEDYFSAADMQLDSLKWVANNGTYSMFIDETTSIVKVVLNSSCPAPNSPEPNKCSVVYETAKSKGLSSEEKSNIIVRYFLDNGTINSYDLNGWTNSVQYENRIVGQTERHYSLNYNVENGVDVLYDIGNFINVNSYFPIRFDRSRYDELFRGNTIFNIPTESKLLSSAGSGQVVLSYSGTGRTFSAECAAYLEENGLATVSENLDVNGNSLGSWSLSNMLDSNNRLKPQLGVDYNTNALEGESGYSPCTSNPYTTSTILDNYIYRENSYQLEAYANGDTTNLLNTNVNQYTENSSTVFRFCDPSTLTINKLLKYMYTINEYDDEGNQIRENFYTIPDTISTTDRTVYYDYKGDGTLEPFKIGGFQARDDEGRFLYDEEGSPIQAGFTQELAEEQNVLFGNDSEAKSTSFRVGIRFQLTEDGFKVTILNNSIKENSSAEIYQIILLPYFTATKDENSEGQIIVPDGSGAIISFNSPKDIQNVSRYEKAIHGEDITIPKETMSEENEYLNFGMYGFLDQTTKKGVVAIVDKGASMSWIQADFRRNSVKNSYNFARFITDFRRYEEVEITNGGKFNKWTNDYYRGDVVYDYRFLDSDKLTYVEVANTYRDYLLDKYADQGLSENGDTTTTHVPTITFLGAYEKKDLLFGVVYNKDYSLTTFEEAKEILDELNENGVDDFNVIYQGWTKEALEQSITKEAKASSVLGGKKGLNSFNEYMKEKGYGFYPYLSIIMGQGYDYNFGSLKYSPKSVTSNYSTIAAFVMSTRLSDSTMRPTVLISPRFYQSSVSNLLKRFNRYDIDGVYVDTLGALSIGDYSKKNLIYTETGAMYQQEVLNTLRNSVGKVMSFAPYEYAMPYVSAATNVPLTATMLPIIDYSIPLYQLVVSGMFDYSGYDVNLNDDNIPEWYFLKALETGSNLAFTLSASDTKDLLETNYTMYYGAYYLNWKQKIIQLNKQLNDLGIYKSRLVNHQYVTDNVVEVEYANGLKLMINFDDDSYRDSNTGLTIAANWYIILEEGK